MTMPSEVMIPFAIDALGNVAHTEDLAQQLANHIVMIVATELNSRVMDPLYGAAVDPYLFDNIQSPDVNLLTANIEIAVTDNEPLVQVVDVQAVSDPDNETTLGIQIFFTIPDALGSATATYVATVNIDNGVVSG
jgi:phage baseplate assembly protein W